MEMCGIPLRVGGEIKWTRGRPTLAFAGQKRPSVPRHPDAFAEKPRRGRHGRISTLSLDYYGYLKEKRIFAATK